MTYVSYLSARGLLRNTLIIFLVGALLLAYTCQHALSGHGHFALFHGDDHILASITGVAGFFALIVATIRAASLDVLTRTPAITFTRPLSRTNVALQNFGLDAATVLIVWIVAIAILIGFVSAIDGFGDLGSPLDALEVGALMGSVMLMWYALVTLLSTLIPGRGGAIVGISWAVFAVLPGIAQIDFPQPIAGLIHLLLFVDPLFYLTGWHGSFSFGDHGIEQQKTVIHAGIRSAAAAVIGVIALIAAVQVWIRKDASA
jgi:hypothetical protein